MRQKLVLLGVLLATLPFFAQAFPFGGQIGQIIFCYNDAIYANVGPPRGGPMIWTPSTKTYQFGPPAYSGQWLLGLAAPPYYCLVSRSPIIVWSGILMTMEASSGGGAPAYVPAVQPSSGSSVSAQPALPSLPAVRPNQLPQGGSPALPQRPGIGKLVISEIFYAVDPVHGSDPSGEWVELYNGSNDAIDLSGWTINDASATTTLPGSFSIAPNTFALVMASPDVLSRWTVPSTAQKLTLSGLIGNGLSAAGDALFIKDKTGKTIDSASWGGNSSVFDPSAPSVSIGHSMARKSLETDAHAYGDWIELGTPTPGK